MPCAFKIMDSPVGKLTLVARNEKLAAVLWEEEKSNRVKLGVLAEDNVHPTLCETERQLIEYFSGNRTQFALELSFAGTDFQNKVWQALLTIPYGQTRSYSDIAK